MPIVCRVTGAATPRIGFPNAAAAKRGGKRIGYVRVSSVGQNEVRRLDRVELDKTFTDKCSGKDTARPQLHAALDYLRDGDVLIVHSMDRLARNLDDLRKEGLLFTGEDNAMSNLLLNVMGAFAEFERSLIRERQREGIALAKKAGVYTGRKPPLTPAEVAEIRKRVKAGETIASLGREYDVSRQTLYQHGAGSGE